MSTADGSKDSADSARPALPVVLENRRLCIVDKPAGWLSVPSRLGAADPRPCVGLALQEQLRCRLWPGGEDRLLALCHPHGAKIEWQTADR